MPVSGTGSSKNGNCSIPWLVSQEKVWINGTVPSYWELEVEMLVFEPVPGIVLQGSAVHSTWRLLYLWF